KDRPPPPPPPPAPPVAASASENLASPPLRASWCAEGARALDEETCFVVPESLGRPPAVVFFAHGMVAPGTTPREEMDVVRDAAMEHGFVAVFPRGVQGLCAWKPEVASHYCWPTRAEAVDGSAGEILARWADAQAKIEEIVGATFSRRYVLG